jgi:ABC-type branched-subunit amino acid transport system substrate-binding protein
METMRRRSFALGLAAAVAAPPLLARGTELVVGQVAPLSGVLASTGQQMVLGGRLVFEQVNATGGIHGRPIRHVVTDEAYKVDETVRLTRELLADRDLLALFGFAGTSNVARLLSDQVLAEGGAALVAPYTGGEALRTPFNPWIFHLRAGYADETEHMVNQAVTLGLRRIAVMYQDDGFGQAGLDGVRKALAKRQLTLAAAAGYERNTEKVDEAARRIKDADAQAVIMISVNKPTAAFLRRYRELGGGAQLYNISVVDAAEIVRLAGLKPAHGLGISQVVPYPYVPALPVVREFHELLRRHAPEAEVNYTNFEEFLGAKVLVEGLRRAGPNPTRARVVAALESLARFDLGGHIVGYGPQNRVGSRYVEVTVIGGSGKLMR